MVTIERITSTGDVEQDAQAIRELHQESLAANPTLEEAQARERAAREAALEPPRNALVDTPYHEGETLEVIVTEDDTKNATDPVEPVRRVSSSPTESVVDAQKAKPRKTVEGDVTTQAISSPQPPVK